MKKVLVAYYSRTGKTQKMADYIAEGIRLSGNAVEMKKIVDIKSEKDIEGYDGYIFGCPTYHKSITKNFETFLFLVEKAGLKGKIGGAFGSSTHSGEAPGVIFDTMEHVFAMKMTNLGPFDLRENVVDSNEGIKACQDYGRTLGGMLN
ncbi:flavodoxin domain-containing protein [Desulfoprunum benzoelyticum]|uniref:Flavodoxin n=1 Tax=Desulfoprunum benzoelyticum TaxID=1506996 RepID=A0A840UU23_9BACT|nr:flavodoxin domain-containing protein [Desulfoprunum benzoelyticum]MBB5349697.1 flavodoxin [Desulfoprunum benzoelyticum]MBM9531760.1 flavodoxin domain-containing protein [Desulfoprunum benzoelyticum]